jgi:predicted transcriptional regulator
MNGLGMNTSNYENGSAPSLEVAIRLSRYFNKMYLLTGLYISSKV